jgi:CubicO group peptidase (beta-lactamase class C family)
MLFRNGSVGKMLTAAALVSLAEEGKLNYHKAMPAIQKG